jgi:hypothetical protein
MVSAGHGGGDSHRADLPRIYRDQPGQIAEVDQDSA